MILLIATPYLIVTSSDYEAVANRCSVKKIFLEISQNLQENTCTKGLQLYLKRDSGTGFFL